MPVSSVSSAARPHGSQNRSEWSPTVRRRHTTYGCRCCGPERRRDVRQDTLLAALIRQYQRQGAGSLLVLGDADLVIRPTLVPMRAVLWASLDGL